MLKLYYAYISNIKVSDSIPLSAYRKKRLNKISSERSRRESLAAEALFNYAVRDCLPKSPLPANIICTQSGKPHISDASFYFNLSHSKDMAVCAICSSDIGVDIQYREVCREALVRRFFAFDEQSYIFSSSDRDAAFSEIWCKKESYIKALGTGMKMPLNSFSVIGVNEIQYFTINNYHLACYSPHTDEIAELKKMALYQ